MDERESQQAKVFPDHSPKSKQPNHRNILNEVGSGGRILLPSTIVRLYSSRLKFNGLGESKTAKFPYGSAVTLSEFINRIDPLPPVIASP
jgi:hypothetical protein